VEKWKMQPEMRATEKCMKMWKLLILASGISNEQRNAIFPTFSALINSPNLVNSPYFFSLASKCGKFTEVIYANAMSIFHFP